MKEFSKYEAEILLSLARNAITEYIEHGKRMQVDPQSLPERLRETGAAFVTLTIDDNLRGCIGHIEAFQPLYSDVLENAWNAAFADTRFQPLRRDELDDVEIEVSVMNPYVPFLYKTVPELEEYLTIHKPGVIIRYDQYQALFLPQVWEQLPDPGQFLNHLCMKAGLMPEFWKTGKLKVETNTVLKYKEL